MKFLGTLITSDVLGDEVGMQFIKNDCINALVVFYHRHAHDVDALKELFWTLSNLAANQNQDAAKNILNNGDALNMISNGLNDRSEIVNRESVFVICNILGLADIEVLRVAICNALYLINIVEREIFNPLITTMKKPNSNVAALCVILRALIRVF